MRVVGEEWKEGLPLRQQQKADAQQQRVLPKATSCGVAEVEYYMHSAQKILDPLKDPWLTDIRPRVEVPLLLLMWQQLQLTARQNFRLLQKMDLVVLIGMEIETKENKMAELTAGALKYHPRL